MKLEGSCECQKVKFTCQSETPVPFMYCFCSICRKTCGVAFGCNIMGLRRTLKVTGKAHLKLHRARIRRRGRKPELSMGERWFCGACGSHLYLTDPRWPDHFWPSAGAIDTKLPVAPEDVYIMTAHKPDWVPARLLANGPSHAEYPPLSIQAWHEQHGLLSKRPQRNAAAKATARKARAGKAKPRKAATPTAKRRGATMM